MIEYHKVDDNDRRIIKDILNEGYSMRQLAGAIGLSKSSKNIARLLSGEHKKMTSHSYAKLMALYGKEIGL